MKKILLILLLFCVVTNAQDEDIQNEILNLNVMTWKFEGLNQKKVKSSINEIIKVMRSNEVHIAAFQGIDSSMKIGGKQKDLIKEIADSLNMYFAFGGTDYFFGSPLGNAVIAKYPLVKTENIKFDFSDDSVYGMLKVNMMFEGSELTFVSANLPKYSDDKKGSIYSAEMIIENTKNDMFEPVLLAGNFQCGGFSDTYRKLMDKFFDCWDTLYDKSTMTYPSKGPNKRYDYIWVMNNFYNNDKVIELDPVEIKTINSKLSNNLPVVVNFEYEL